MMVRTPKVAGQFYPSSAIACRSQLSQCLGSQIDDSKLPGQILAGIVPHAGWACSGAVAGKVFKAISLVSQVQTFVLFGAVHSYGVSTAAMFDQGSWETPLGQVQVDQRLAQRILSNTNLIRPEPYAHEAEHSIEVQIPFIQELFGQARIVPIMVPPDQNAAQVGNLVARTIQTYRAQAICIGTTDLTHYGPGYGFVPKGQGEPGIRWAKEQNDQRLLNLIVDFDAEAVVARAQADQSACGAGAIAATLAAARQLGCTEAVIMEHTTSHEVLGDRYGDGAGDSVGYAGIVFGSD